MNVFRLMLLLAGVAVCLGVRYATSPGENASEIGGAPVQVGGEESSLIPLLVYDGVEYGGKRVAVNVAESEPRYQVSTVEGEVLARDLSSDDLQTQFPDIYAFMQTNGVTAAERPTSVAHVATRPMVPEGQSH